MSDKNSASIPARRCLLVLGMHRSGTSATAGLLRVLGFDLGDRLMPASADNPKGYYEHLDAVALNDAMLAALDSSWNDPRPFQRGWAQTPHIQMFRPLIRNFLEREFGERPVWAMKDPRLCRLLPAWQPALSDLGLATAYLLVLRHPAEVAASLRFRDGLDEETTGLLWLRYVLESERATRKCNRAWIHYSRLLADPAASLQMAAVQLGFGWPTAWPDASVAVTQFLDPKLKRQSVDGFTRFPQPIRSWVEALHTALIAARTDRDHVEACAETRRALEHYDRLSRISRSLLNTAWRLRLPWPGITHPVDPSLEQCHAEYLTRGPRE